jgi:chaperonin cofactor prefoldin
MPNGGFPGMGRINSDEIKRVAQRVEELEQRLEEFSLRLDAIPQDLKDLNKAIMNLAAATRAPQISSVW